MVTTDQFGQTITLSGATDGAVITTTDAAGNTITTTYHPGGEPIRSVQLVTSTLGDGSQQTLTSVAVIVPTVVPPGDNNKAQSSTPTVDGSPALVTGNVAVQSKRFGAEVSLTDRSLLRSQMLTAFQAIALVVGAAGVAALL